MWLLTAVMLPGVAGWMLVQRMLHARRGSGRSLQTGSLVAIAVGTGLAVAVFCAVVALAFQH